MKVIDIRKGEEFMYRKYEEFIKKCFCKVDYMIVDTWNYAGHRNFSRLENLYRLRRALKRHKVRSQWVHFIFPLSDEVKTSCDCVAWNVSMSDSIKDVDCLDCQMMWKFLKQSGKI